MNRTFLLVAELFAPLTLPVQANSNKGKKSQIIAGQNDRIDKGAENSVIVGGNLHGGLICGPIFSAIPKRCPP